MNQNNLDYLKKGLKYLGFGEQLNEKLENEIKKQPEHFQIPAVGDFKDSEVHYNLDFKKSNQTDMYFFNSYKASLKHEDPEKEKEQTFYINKNAGITAKEAYNLLSGRSVNKNLVNAEGQPYNAWVQLDFTEKDKHDNYMTKQFTPGYGYDLEKTLTKYPVKEMADPDQKEKLIKSLEKGNLHQVTFNKDGNEEKMYISANPQFKSLNVYDHQMKKVFQENEKKVQAEPRVKLKEKKESLSDDGDEPSPTKKGKSKKRSMAP